MGFMAYSVMTGRQEFVWMDGWHGWMNNGWMALDEYLLYNYLAARASWVLVPI